MKIKFSHVLGALIVASLVFWGCEKQQTFNPPYPPPPPPSPIPSVLPKPAQFQSGNLKVEFEDRDLKTCEVSGNGSDAQLVVDFDNASQTYLSFRLRKFNLAVGTHKTIDPNYGWIFLKTPNGTEFRDNDTEYYVYYAFDPNRTLESSFCTSSYTLNGKVLQLSFDCTKLYNSSGKTRDFKGSFTCSLRGF